MINNQVVAGDYAGKLLNCSISKRCLYIKTGFREKFYINRDTVDHYNVVNEKYHSKSSLGKSLVGGALFGAAGTLVGAASTKAKGEYKIEVYFKNGEKSLLSMDDNCYNLFIQSCF